MKYAYLILWCSRGWWWLEVGRRSQVPAWVIILLVTARHRELESQPTGDNMDISAITNNIEELYAWHTESSKIPWYFSHKHSPCIVDFGASTSWLAIFQLYRQRAASRHWRGGAGPGSLKCAFNIEYIKKCVCNFLKEMKKLQQTLWVNAHQHQTPYFTLETHLNIAGILSSPRWCTVFLFSMDCTVEQRLY